MTRFAANLSWMWPDVDPYARFGRAADAGFQQVEFLFPDELERPKLLAALWATGQDLVLIDLPPGDRGQGERGLLGIPGREAAFWETFELGLSIAADTGTRLINALVGMVPPGTPNQAVRDTVLRNLERATPRCEAADVVLMLEALNDRDRPGVWLTSVDEAARLVQAADSPRVRLQFDQYNTARMDDDARAKLRAHFALVEHVQIADAPGRHEPGIGTQPIQAFLADLDELGYGGYVGLEYGPVGDTDTGLSWLREYRAR